jgi:uncharacterized protein DUF3365/methyl-accepting chemotaxis protein-like sensor
MKRGILRGMGALVVAGSLAALALLFSAQAADKAADDAAVARTRKQVMMLDDLYKTAIVLVTENYVDETSDLAAGAAFQKLFEAMRKKGHHDVRLLDATGQPYNDKNLPRDDFEKAAIAALKAGKPTYEQVVDKEGKRYLKVATPIPVVMQKCTLCHPAYEKAKSGESIGALAYTIAVE